MNERDEICCPVCANFALGVWDGPEDFLFSTHTRTADGGTITCEASGLYFGDAEDLALDLSRPSAGAVQDTQPRRSMEFFPWHEHAGSTPKRPSPFFRQP